MQFRNTTRAKVITVEGKLCIQLPDELINQLNLSDSDSLDVALDKGKVRLWKSPTREIPPKVYDELYKLFKGNEQIISEWLCTPRVDFEGKTAMELIDTPEGIKVVEGFVYRLKTGDLS
jgi:antitoxin component of MazEF toxin-antitoxin module